MIKLKFSRFYLITIISVFLSLLFFCNYHNPLDIPKDTINNSANAKGSLAKLPTSDLYISSRTDLQIMFLRPNYDWKMHDLTEGGSIIFLYSPNNLVNSPAEDLLPRFTIVEMTHKIDNGRVVEAHWRGEKLKEKYGDNNVEILKIEDSNISGIVCTHFSYKVNYPVSGKIAISDEYGFYNNGYYYIIQFSKSVNNGNDNEINEAFDKLLNSLEIIKTLIS